MRLWLRDRYIGAVLIGFLLYSCVSGIIRAVENPLLLAVQRWAQHSALSAGQPTFNKAAVVAALIDAAFNLLAAVVLGLWIYRPEATVPVRTETVTT